MEQSAERRFQEFYRAHEAAVLAYARRRAPAIAEDVVAETFLVCWRRLDDVPANALPWLYAVARNVLANERRKQARIAPAWEGLGFGAAAAVLSCSRVACRVRFHRAKGRLAVLLAEAPASSPRPHPEGATR
jgi:RNA polymerase sigma-70 factor (ECF subfamily)